MHDAFTHSMQLATANALPLTLKAAIELDLLMIIARAGPDAELFPEEIVALLPTINPEAASMVDRIRRLLANYAILICSLVQGAGEMVPRRYGLAPVSGLLTKSQDGVSTGRFALLNQEKVLMECWCHLKESVLSGGTPFRKAFGMNVFEYLENHPRLNAIFNAAMAGPSTITKNKMLEKYHGFDGLGVLVDVGGGVGATMKMIIAKHPCIKGLNLGLPHVIAEAPAILGVEHVAGDMFKSVPHGDAILMKILHGWSDEQCLTVLKNCRKALPDGGKVIVIEGILPESPEMTWEAQALANFDKIMLAATRGGRERTEKEFEALSKGAGFLAFENVCGAFDTRMMEFRK